MNNIYLGIVLASLSMICGAISCKLIFRAIGMNKKIKSNITLFSNFVKNYIKEHSDPNKLALYSPSQQKIDEDRLPKNLYPSPIPIKLVPFIGTISTMLDVILVALTIFCSSNNTFLIKIILVCLVVYILLVAMYIFYLKKHHQIFTLTYSLRKINFPTPKNGDFTIIIKEFDNLLTSLLEKRTLIYIYSYEFLNFATLFLIINTHLILIHT